MTPLGHLASAYLAGHYLIRYQPERINLTALLIGALLPDVDFLFLGWDAFGQIHRVVTHNLLFVGLTAAPWVLLRPPQRGAAITLSMLLGGLLHLLADACLDGNSRNGIGIALWWPLSSAPVSPINLMAPFVSDQGWSHLGARVHGALISLIYETPFIVAAVIIGVKNSRIPGFMGKDRSDAT